MRLKRILSIIVSVSMAISMLTFKTSAHNYDFFSGTYMSNSPCNQSSIGFVVYASAQNSLLNYNNVYSKAFAWNNVSSKVSVRIAMYSSGMPTTTFFGVIGEDLGSKVAGMTSVYDANGNAVSANSNWYRVTITMNNGSIFNSASSPSQAAAMTFIHEVGHALKLSHPAMDSNLSNHTYEGGRPCAIMNQGFPNQTYIPTAPVLHDKQNLMAKWGA